MATPVGYHDVDLACENGTFVFYFVDDSLYNLLPETSRRQDPRAVLLAIQNGLLPTPNCTASSSTEIVSSRHIVEIICQWFWERNVEFAIFDVGSHVGRFAIEIGNYVRYCGKPLRIMAFEPGLTCDLIRYSVELNGLGPLIDVRKLAVSDVDGPLLFAESDSETNVASLWRKSYHDRTIIARSVSLKSALRWVPNIRNIIMKLDVEGAEPLVLAEAARLKPQCKFITICEIVPWRFDGWAGAAEYVRSLSNDYHLINIHSFLYDYTFSIVTDDAIARLMEEVAARPSGFTDVLLIPRELEGADELVSRIAALKSEH